MNQFWDISFLMLAPPTVITLRVYNNWIKMLFCHRVLFENVWNSLYKLNDLFIRRILSTRIKNIFMRKRHASNAVCIIFLFIYTNNNTFFYLRCSQRLCYIFDLEIVDLYNTQFSSFILFFLEISGICINKLFEIPSVSVFQSTQREFTKRLRSTLSFSRKVFFWEIKTSL